MAEVAEKNLKTTTTAVKGMAETIKRFMEALMQWLLENQRLKKEVILADWIKKGGEMDCIEVKAGVFKEMCYELEKAKIPYIVMEKDDRQLLALREIDIEKAKEINKELAIAKCNYYQTTDVETMENALSKSKLPEKKKEVVSISGLSDFEWYVLKNKSNNITKGFMIAGGKDAEGANIAQVRADNVSSREGKDFCKSYLEAMVSCHGINGDIRKKQVAHDIKFDAKVQELLNKGETFYIVGSQTARSHTYIKVTPDGFSYMHGKTEKDGKLMSIEDKKVDATEKDYKEQLQKYMDTIMDKSVLMNEGELNKLKENQTEYITGRPQKDKDAALRGEGNDLLITKIDNLIDSRLNENDYANKAEFFRAYIEESNKLITAVANLEYPSDYKEEEIDSLHQIVNEHKIDPDSLVPVAKRMMEISKTVEQHHSRSGHIKEVSNVERTTTKQFDIEK